jgi:ankyrin repeat protein
MPELTDEELRFLDSALDLARQGNTADLVELVNAGLPANLTNSAGDSLLILAAYHDQPETVTALIALGAHTSRINDRGQTALATAVFRQNPASVASLLDAGADPALGARSALAIAEFFGLADMQAMLRDRAATGKPSTP